jgi:hypothetical protein
VGICALAIAGGICTQIIEGPGRRTVRGGVLPPSGKVPPPPGPPTGKCAGIRDGSGPVPCPYGPAAAPVADPDFAIPFQKEGRTCESPGSLQLTSGSVVAADPFINIEAPGTAVRFPPGRYPVIFSVKDDDIEYALLKITDERPVRWEVALEAGEPPLKPDEWSGYGVDTGTGCYLDVDAAFPLGVRSQALATPNLLDIAYAEGYEKGDWANLCVNPTTGTNLIVFKSGIGDGVYPVFVGYGATGAPIALVTDFRIGDIGFQRHPWFDGPAAGGE